MDVSDPVGQLGSLACDHYHHFYHYQSSAQYLWSAEALRRQKKEEDAQIAYRKALFQDHYNTEASQRKEVCTAPYDILYIPRYDKHPLLDSAFCASIGQQAGPATALHDAAMEAYAKGDGDKAVQLLNLAIAQDATHSNSFFARGRLAYLRESFVQAAEDVQEAIRLSHIQHDAYHRAASQEHCMRGREFWIRGEIELAINDYSKALDLWSRNPDARRARAQAYRIKGNNALAELDEAY